MTKTYETSRTSNRNDSAPHLKTPHDEGFVRYLGTYIEPQKAGQEDPRVDGLKSIVARQRRRTLSVHRLSSQLPVAQHADSWSAAA